MAAGDTSVRVVASPPFNPPADPGGEFARVTIVDDLRRPTTVEVITYTSAQPDGGGTILSGVQRGQDGTDDQEWSIGSFAIQDLPAALLGALTPVIGGEIVGLSGPYLRSKTVRAVDIVGHNWPAGPILLKSVTAPPAPNDGVVVYMTSGQLFAKFPNGSVVTVASA